MTDFEFTSDQAVRAQGGPAGSPPSALRTLGNNSTWSSASTIGTMVLRTLESIVVARYLGPAGLGLWALIVAFPEAIQQLSDSRTRDAVPKFVGEALVQGDKTRAVALMKMLWLVDVTLSAAAFLIVVFAADFAARVFMHNESLAPLIVIYASAKLIAAFRAPAGGLVRTMNRFDVGFWTQLAADLTRFGVIALVLLTGHGLTGIVFAVVVAEFAGTLIVGGATLAIFLPSHWTARFARISTLGSERRALVKFLVFTNLSATVVMIGSKCDVLLIGALSSSTTVGIYSLAVQLGMTILLISDPIQIAVYPQVAKALKSGRMHEVRQAVGRLTGLLAAIVVSLAVAAIFLARPVIVRLFGPAYAPATVPFLVLLWLVAPSAILFWGRPFMLSLGEAPRLFRYFVAGLIAQFSLLVLLLRPLGPLGGTIGLGVNYLIIVTLEMIFLLRSDMLRGSHSPLPVADGGYAKTAPPADEAGARTARLDV